MIVDYEMSIIRWLFGYLLFLMTAIITIIYVLSILFLFMINTVLFMIGQCHSQANANIIFTTYIIFCSLFDIHTLYILLCFLILILFYYNLFVFGCFVLYLGQIQQQDYEFQ